MTTGIGNMTWEQLVHSVILDGEPETIDAVADDWVSVLEQVSTLAEDLHRDVAQIEESWSGDAYQGFKEHIGTMVSDLELVVSDIAGDGDSIANILREAAENLAAAQSNMVVPSFRELESIDDEGGRHFNVDDSDRRSFALERIEMHSDEGYVDWYLDEAMHRNFLGQQRGSDGSTRVIDANGDIGVPIVNDLGQYHVIDPKTGLWNELSEEDYRHRFEDEALDWYDQYQEEARGTASGLNSDYGDELRRMPDAPSPTATTFNDPNADIEAVDAPGTGPGFDPGSEPGTTFDPGTGTGLTTNGGGDIGGDAMNLDPGDGDSLDDDYYVAGAPGANTDSSGFDSTGGIDGETLDHGGLEGAGTGGVTAASSGVGSGGIGSGGIGGGSGFGSAGASGPGGGAGGVGGVSGLGRGGSVGASGLGRSGAGAGRTGPAASGRPVAGPKTPGLIGGMTGAGSRGGSAAGMARGGGAGMLGGAGAGSAANGGDTAAGSHLTEDERNRAWGVDDDGEDIWDAFANDDNPFS